MEEYPPWDVVKEVKVNCVDCTAECCKHISIPLEKPETLQDYQTLADYVQYRDIVVYQDHENDWMVEFKTRCGQLQGNRCMAFKDDKQPMTCREYEVKTCVMNEVGEYWNVMFTKPEDVASYVKKKNLGVIRTTRRKECDIECCNHLSVHIDEPDEWRDFDDIRWYVAHKDSIAYKDEDGDWLVEFRTRPKERCPRCDGENCANDTHAHEMIFTCMEDVDAYLAERQIVKPVGKTPLTLTEY